MTIADQILNRGPISRVRRNHALEHATLQVMAEKNPHLRAAGYSDARGFWLMGALDTQQIEMAVQEALARLRSGESNLAIHPNCGTNLVANALLAGSFAWMGMLGAGRSWRDRVERWPLVISLATVGLLLSQPLGPFLQARFTTQAATQGLEIISIQRIQRGDSYIHRVLTQN